MSAARFAPIWDGTPYVYSMDSFRAAHAFARRTETARQEPEPMVAPTLTLTVNDAPHVAIPTELFRKLEAEHAENAALREQIGTITARAEYAEKGRERARAIARDLRTELAEVRAKLADEQQKRANLADRHAETAERLTRRALDAEANVKHWQTRAAAPVVTAVTLGSGGGTGGRSARPASDYTRITYAGSAPNDLIIAERRPEFRAAAIRKIYGDNVPPEVVVSIVGHAEGIATRELAAVCKSARRLIDGHLVTIAELRSDLEASKAKHKRATARIGELAREQVARIAEVVDLRDKVRNTARIELCGNHWTEHAVIRHGNETMTCIVREHEYRAPDDAYSIDALAQFRVAPPTYRIGTASNVADRRTTRQFR